MRNPHLTVCIILGWTCIAHAQFSYNAVKWPTPQGGMIWDAYPMGFNYIAPIITNNTVSENSQTWNLLDMNGDGKPDLVVTSQCEGVNATPTEFGVGTSPHWEVYLNTGSSFSSTATIWPTPDGGTTYSTSQGFYDVTGISNGGADSSQLWSLIDMDGDGKPDLVLTGIWSDGQAVQYNATSNPCWVVYLNTGTGFSSTAITWPTPNGGFIVNGSTHLGYNVPTNIGTNNPSGGGASDSSQYWTLVDMNGDGKPDLVITALVDTGTATQFGAGAAPYWIVYLNTGSGFSATPSNWPTPSGGTVFNGALLGYNQASVQEANDYFFVGSQVWSLTDMNGDGKPDLVVTGSLTNVHGYAAQFNSTRSPYWLVYLNTGTGFALDSLIWRTPLADSALLGDTLGLVNIGQVPGVQLDEYNQWSVSSQQWSLVDMNGDGKPDLVITGEQTSGVGIIGELDVEFEAGTSPFWEVSLNTGSGFDTLRPAWATPIGGDTLSIQTAGYNYIGTVVGLDITSIASGQSWSLTDIDGDGVPELVVESNSGTGGNVEFSDSTGPYWQVFKNTVISSVPDNRVSAPCLIYPNPSNGSWRVLLGDDLPGGTAEVFDATGRLVFKAPIYKQQLVISLPNATAGIYELQITGQDNTITRKLVKM